MSIDSVLARMNALQALVDTASGVGAPPATDSTAGFSAALAGATGSTRRCWPA